MSCVSPKNFRSSYVVIRSANYELEAPLYQGDFSASGHQEGYREVTVYTAQGDNYAVKETNQVNPSISFTCHFPGWSSTEPKRLMDLILRRGAYAGSIRSDAICGDAYLLDVEHVIRGDGSDPDERVVYRGCRLVADYQQGDPDTISVSGTCYTIPQSY